MNFNPLNVGVLILCTLLSGIDAEDSTNPYCSISSCATKSGGETNNTLCLYSNTTYGGFCAPINSQVVVSAADITTILTVSNNYRSNVALGNEAQGNPGPQPSATNMMELSWDTELANMAQTYAQRCVYAHDTCRDVSRFKVGQNLYVKMSTASFTTTNWTAAIGSWYNEVSIVTPASFASYPSSSQGIGHYTQLVWGNTYLVGCGIASYMDTTYYKTNYPYKMLYVCNYGPAGNYVGQSVYGNGTTGSACPSGTTLNANYEGLCG